MNTTGVFDSGASSVMVDPACKVVPPPVVPQGSVGCTMRDARELIEAPLPGGGLHGTLLHPEGSVMALVTCPQCGTAVPDSAVTCDACGAMIPPENRIGADAPTIHGWLMAVALWFPVMLYGALRSFEALGDMELRGTFHLLEDVTSPAIMDILQLLHLVLGGLVIWTMVRFFAKRRSAPRMMVVAVVLQAVIELSLLVIFWTAIGEPARGHTLRTTVPALLAALILVPYLLRSTRVRATFVR